MSNLSNLSKRVLAGIVGIPLLLLASYFGGYYLLGLTLIINTLALWEFCSMFEKKEIYPLKILTVITANIILLITVKTFKDSGAYVSSYFLTLSILSSAFFITLEVFRKEKRNPINPAISIFGIIYITLSLFLMNMLHKPSQEMFIIIIFILIWTCDSMAYFGGRMFGKHKLSDISPNKTWEGSITGFIFTVIISVLLFYIIPHEMILIDFIIIGIIIGIFSQVGDLFESMIKRFCGVKDSSNIIPGHGGILDRFDSLILVIPVIYLYMSLGFF